MVKLRELVRSEQLVSLILERHIAVVIGMSICRLISLSPRTDQLIFIKSTDAAFEMFAFHLRPSLGVTKALMHFRMYTEI
jgi:hypothetical protein